MIYPISKLSVDVIPQAIIDRSVVDVVGSRTDVVTSSDDFDTFEGASFKLDGSVEIAVRHYSGYPNNTATIYIDSRISDLKKITGLIRTILREFGLSEKDLHWERAKDPDL